MNRKKWLSTLVLLVLVTVATGCSSVLRPAADAAVPVEDELALGQEMEAELQQDLEFSDDEVLSEYVVELGNDIVRRVDDRPRGLRFRFHLVDDPDVINAFAVPGGGIYVYSGLILAMENEAELTAVLAHEVAHVTRRHIAQRLVAMYGADLVAQMALGEQPGTLGQLVNSVVQTGVFLRYSRDQERDADRYGVRYHAAAGYNPEGFVTFFQKLEGQPAPPSFLSSHPAPSERVQNIRGHIDELDSVPDRLEVDRFMEMRSRLE